MLMLLAQAETAEKIGTEIIRGAGRFSAETFVLVVFMLLVAVFAGLWIYFVGLPDSKARRQIDTSLTQIIGSTHQTTSATNVDVVQIKDSLEILLTARAEEYAILSELARSNPSLNLTERLARLQTIYSVASIPLGRPDGKVALATSLGRG